MSRSLAGPVLVLVGLLVTPGGSLWSAEPPAAEWASVQAEVRFQVSGGIGRLMALTAQYPDWAEGRRELAAAQLAAGRPEPALAAARSAAALGDVAALGLEIRALGALQRPAEAYAVVDAASDRDARGWLRYEAGLVAVAAGEPARAETYLAEARSRAAGQVPPEFLYLESRIAVATGNYPRAEQALASAVIQRPGYATGWYDLVRVRIVLADRDPEAALELLAKAGEAAAQAVPLAPRDARVQLALARTTWLHGRALARAGQEAAATEHWQRADAQARAVLALAEQAEAIRIIGDCAFRRGDWAEAANFLGRARRLGEVDRAVTFNLAAALRHLQRDREADEILAGIASTGPVEDLAVALDAYDAGNWSLAHRLFLSGVAGATPETTPAVHRFAGLAAAKLAESAEGSDRTQWLDAARDAWREAGDAGDLRSREYLLAQESRRGPAAALAAGQRALAWTSWQSMVGWGLVIGHLSPFDGLGRCLLWLLAGLAPIAAWVWDLRRRAGRAASYVPTGDARLSGRHPSVSGRQPVAGGKPAAGRPGTTSKPPAGKPAALPEKPPRSAVAAPEPAKPPGIKARITALTRQFRRTAEPTAKASDPAVRSPQPAGSAASFETMQAAPFNPHQDGEALERNPPKGPAGR